jgi:DNA repair exonuclease SbcCD ATPase subunit
MITFRKLRWKNFLSTGNIFTELELDANSTTLVVGENGAGKSTMLDALSFVLFGKPFRKINKPQLLNTIIQKQAVVEVEFSIGLNNYKIIRGIKPNVFQVFQNDILLNQSADMKDYQEVLETQILKVNHKSFCQVVVLGSATFQPFMQLTAYQRREIIEDILDLQIFTTMNSLLKDKVLENTESLQANSSAKKLAEEKLTLIKEHLTQLQNSNEKMIDEKKQRILETSKEVARIEYDYAQWTENNRQLEDCIGDQPAVSKRFNKLNELRHKIEANLGTLNKEVSFFHKYDNCPTCKQEIDEAFKSETVNAKETEINEIKEGLDKLSQEYEAAENRISNILTIVGQINDNLLQMKGMRVRIASLNEYIDSLKEEITNINETIAQEDTSKVPDLEKEMKALENKYNELSEEKNVLSVVSNLLKDGGIKSKIIKQYIPVINKLINKYLSAMEFMCQFELDEQFNETIKSRYRDVFSYASFSEGEKMRINLAILFTWRSLAKLRNSINTNILIMDEVFDSSLDSNGTEEFIKIINSLTSDTNTFIISHKTDQLYDKFEKVIKFEKVKNFSRIAA